MTTDQRMEEELEELFRILRAYVRQKGYLTSYEPDVSKAFHDAYTSLQTTERLTAPASVQLFSGFNTAIGDDTEDLAHLEARLVAKLLDYQLRDAANERLITEHSTLPAVVQVPRFGSLSWAEKYAQLLFAKEKLRNPPVATFNVKVVTKLLQNGCPESMVPIYLPVSTKWSEFQSAIRDVTGTWQSAEAGFLAGYGLKEGGWVVQYIANGQSTRHVLRTERQYRDLRSEAQKETSRENGPVIWHVMIQKASDDAKTRAAELRDVRSKEPNREPMNADGTPMFEPTFEESDWERVAYEEPESPAFERLSEERPKPQRRSFRF